VFCIRTIFVGGKTWGPVQSKREEKGESEPAGEREAEECPDLYTAPCHHQCQRRHLRYQVIKAAFAYMVCRSYASYVRGQ